MKKIYDPVHGFIRFNELEKELIDSVPFQRLHYIHQLGVAYLVYPGATHTRFEHSLGTMELASQIFDRIVEKFFGLGEEESRYWRQIVRLAALCHDLGHLPFSHVAEKALLGVGGHEKWTLAAIQSLELAPLWEKLGRNAQDEITKVALGEELLQEMGIGLSFSAQERIFSQIITGDFFGADRIDYLVRDARCTGVSHGLFDYHQLIEMLSVSLEKRELGIEEGGVASCEALLIARHFMHQRVYQHPSVKAYSFHLSNFMQRYYERGGYLESLASYWSQTDSEVLAAIRVQAFRGDLDAQVLLKQRKKFFAFTVGPEVSQENIAELRARLNIPKDSLVSVIKPNKSSTSRFFPVHRTGGKPLDSITLPKVTANWIYVAPDYESLVQKELALT